MNDVLVDTSFLISYATPSRKHHADAVAYFKEFVVRGVTMHLSTVVISEFHVRQSITALGLKNFQVVPFNIEHAIAAAKLTDAAHAENEDDLDRVLLKDDVKLLAQCELQGIGHFITEDRKCLANLSRLAARFPTRQLPVGINLREGFDPSWFNPGNQRPLPYSFT